MVATSSSSYEVLDSAFTHFIDKASILQLALYTEYLNLRSVFVGWTLPKIGLGGWYTILKHDKLKQFASQKQELSQSFQLKMELLHHQCEKDLKTMSQYDVYEFHQLKQQQEQVSIQLFDYLYNPSFTKLMNSNWKTQEQHQDKINTFLSLQLLEIQLLAQLLNLAENFQAREKYTVIKNELRSNYKKQEAHLRKSFQSKIEELVQHEHLITFCKKYPILAKSDNFWKLLMLCKLIQQLDSLLEIGYTLKESWIYKDTTDKLNSNSSQALQQTAIISTIIDKLESRKSWDVIYQQNLKLNLHQSLIDFFIHQRFLSKNDLTLLFSNPY